MPLVLGETVQVDKQGLLNATSVKVKDIWLGNVLSLSDQGMQNDLGVLDGQAVQTIIPNNAAFQTGDFDTYDSGCDDISNAKAVLMANISNYGSDVILEVPHFETYLNDMENQREVPNELPKASLVNASLKKLKFQLAQFDSVVKKRTTPDAHTEGLKCLTSNYGSKPTCNKKNDRISRTPKNVNNCAKSAKKHKKQNIWKPTGHVFTEVGLKLKPTGRTFTIVEPNHTWGSNATDIPSSSSLVMKGCQIVLWYLDSGCSKHMTGNRSQLMNFVRKFLGTVRFRNGHIARIMGYDDYQLGNVTISIVYYIEGHGHNLFSIGYFCDADHEVAFWKNTFFIRNLEGADLLLRS
uniref:Integrase, catalytic region, zinc finger, CCHC-type, peptidase aspartic, catalytic n=1 Tax=Tanacetum cinerariifolium TaxID=118510 RepID=A0A699I186_TANCI|nr:integrase, catalytic region, zinc finger, CCHC-type, peptidase aspartic, catalytic [Tanacetum cinerariifolium]